MIIRKAMDDNDIKQIAALADIIWHEHFTPIIGAAQVSYMLDKFQSFHAISYAVKKSHYTYFMAIDDSGTLCGYCGVQPQADDSLFLSKLYVRKESRGKGLSRQLLDFSHQHFPQCKSVWLTVNRNNTNTIHIYEHMGFVKMREQRSDIGSGFVMDDYVMELNF